MALLSSIAVAVTRVSLPCAWHGDGSFRLVSSLSDQQGTVNNVAGSRFYLQEKFGTNTFQKMGKPKHP